MLGLSFDSSSSFSSLLAQATTWKRKVFTTHVSLWFTCLFTFMPCEARFLATAAPIPALAPVTRTTRPDQRSISKVIELVFSETG